MQSVLTLLVSLTLAGSLYAARTLRQTGLTAPAIQAGQISAIDPVTVRVDSAGVVVDWQEPRRSDLPTNSTLSGYQVFAGDDPQNLEPVRFVQTSSVRFPNQTYSYFRILPVYDGSGGSSRGLRVAVDDPTMILDFEVGEVGFLPYDEQEDEDGNAWSITAAESYPPSRRSLVLTGNTWKRLPFERTFVTDTTVWQIAVMSVDVDTSGELQAFGIGDGSERLIYDFYGRETVWDEPWMIANKEAKSRGRWQTFKLRIGYDWKIRYGYLPSIDELYFINDNDTTNPAARVYFDEIQDITSLIPPVPEPKGRWMVDDRIDGRDFPIRFRATVHNREPESLSILWDYGDGSNGIGWEPLHFFRNEGLYTVGITAVGDEGLIGRTILNVEVGNVRMQRYANLAFVGDVMLARRYEQNGGVIQQFGPEAVFSKIAHRTRAADLFVINLECPLTDEGIVHPTKDISFRGRPENVAGLVSAGVDVANFANNHVSDYGARGLEETMQVLDAAGIVHSGAGLTEYDALKPAFKTVNGIRFGFLGYCNRTGRDYNARPFLDAGYDKDGYAWLTADNIYQSVPGADEVCDFLIVSIHGGTEYAPAPDGIGQRDPAWKSDWPIYPPAVIDSATRELAHMAIDLGADLIIQHHPHVLQGFEVYKNVPIASSLGNFAFDQDFFETWPSAMVWAKFSRDGLMSLEVEPVFVDRYYPNPATGELGNAILDMLSGYSRPLNAILYTDYSRNRAVLNFRQEHLRETVEQYETALEMREIAGEGIYRSAPVMVESGAYVKEVTGVTPYGHDDQIMIRFGREILLAGNMEREGATFWNYNSNFEAIDSAFVKSGNFSSKLWRNQGQQDGVTDMIQRIPVSVNDEITVMGWMRLNNGRDGGLGVRYYRFRYDNNQNNIFGDQYVEGRQQGSFDWKRLWGELEIPANTAFVNVRWQLYAPQAGGSNQMWVDDVKVIRWEGWQSLGDEVPVDYPNDYKFMQIESVRPLAEATIRYQSVRIE